MLAAWAWGTYIFFAVFLACGMVWVHFYLPETKGASLEDMDRVFTSHRGAADAALLTEARREVGLDPSQSDSTGVFQLEDRKTDTITRYENA